MREFEHDENRNQIDEVHSSTPERTGEQTVSYLTEEENRQSIPSDANQEYHQGISPEVNQEYDQDITQDFDQEFYQDDYTAVTSEPVSWDEGTEAVYKTEQGDEAQSYQESQNASETANQSYATYQFNSNESFDSQGNQSQPQNNKAPKKKDGMGMKVLKFGIAAVFCGAIASASFQVTGHVGNKLFPIVVKSNYSGLQNTTTSGGGSGSSPATTIASTTLMDVSDIVAETKRSMVGISNMSVQEVQSFFGMTYQQETPSSGSGIIVGENESELLIATNNHVVENSSELSVTFVDQESVKAQIKGTDAANDLAVISVLKEDIPEATYQELKIATLGDSDTLREGEAAIALGNALGYGQSVTTGVVSALNRSVNTQDGNRMEGLIQTNAAINPGNSGGALLDAKGEVIGINTAKASSTEIEGIGYAIPISKAQPILDKLMTKRTRAEVESSKRGVLGIDGFTVSSEVNQMYGFPIGVYVKAVVEGGGAEAAGMKAGDIIVSFDDSTISTITDLTDLLAFYEAGETIEVVVSSQIDGVYQERTIEVTLGKRTEDYEENQSSDNLQPDQSDSNEDNNQGGGQGFFDNWEQFFPNY